MAVEVAVGVVAEHLLSEALSLIAEEFTSFLGFKDDLKILAEELEIIQALILDAYGKNIELATIQLWLKRLKVVASDAEDVLEEYKYELLRRKVYVPQKKWDKVRIFFSPIRKLTFRIQMVYRIKNINLRLRKCSDEGKKYGLNPFMFLNISSEVNAIRGTSPYVQESEIIGRDNDVLKVVEMLINTNSEKNVDLIAIVGMGGQGKTTLAQLVSKSDEVVNYFEKILWVCVSEDFKVEKIMNEMVQSITRQNPNLSNRQALIEKIRETLQGKRFLLVLDDVWNEDEEKWESMKKDLGEVGGLKGTKIMVTTRSEKVALTMRASHTHHLSILSDSDSWSLFKRRAFGESGVVENSELATIGQRLVKRCGGVPLAIKALGGLLYSKKDVCEWLNIEKSDIWSNSTNSEGGVMSSIKLSYNHLPSISLKQCFVYCSIFPKDTLIGKESLIQQWMANGFLNPPKGSNLQMEDLGSDYHDILLWNSLLQEPSYNKQLRTWSCKMHDIVHDFALHISRDDCFTMNDDHDANDIVKALHVSLIPNKRKMINIPQGISSKIRTLHLHRRVKFNEDAVLRFGYLRTLKLGDYKARELPTSIGKLKLLKYVDIEGTQIKTLPDSYMKLHNLQVIRLPTSFKQEILYLGTLVNIRHIYIRISITKCMIVGIKELVNLQSLPHFIVSDKKGCKIEELEKLDNLRGSLSIYGLDKVINGEEAQRANISRKLKIDNLELHWTKERDATYDEDVLESLIPHSYLKTLVITYFKGLRFPSWMTTLNNGLLNSLTKVKLEGCDKIEQLPPLGHLPNLQTVKIYQLNNVKRIGMEFYGDTDYLTSTCCPFPALEILYIRGMSNLEEWLRVEHSSLSLQAFPHLRILKVSSCKKLSGLPLLLGLTSLTDLSIYGNANLSELPSLQGLLSLTKLWIKRNKTLTVLPSLQGLPSLTELSIQENEKLTELPPLQGLLSLTKLSIQENEMLIELPSLEGLSSLTELTINQRNNRANGYGLERLPNLTTLDICCFSGKLDFIPWPHTNVSKVTTSAENNENDHLYFSSLKTLLLRGRKLYISSLPEQLEHLPSLTFLSIIQFHGLEALPEWLGNIKSLYSLQLFSNENLKYIPSTGLTNLQELRIWNCPRLKERCIKDSGPEWHKISHIPQIHIN